MKVPRAPRLIVVGSSNTDLVLRCERLPSAGETVLGGEYAESAGGKGANQAVAAARAGARVTFVGAHGHDSFGRLAKAGLRREGINVRHFRAIDGARSGVALILLGGATRENVIAVARSANDEVTREHVEQVEPSFRRADAVVCQLEIPLAAVDAAARLAGRHGVPFILNPAPAQDLSAELLRQVAVLTPNEHEAMLLTGCSSPEASARALLRQGCSSVVVTLGARGALVCNADAECLVAAPAVKAVDTVGAGDCFTAWLAAGVAAGLPLVAAAERAARAASLSVTRPGAQAAMPLAEELNDWPLRSRARRCD